MLRILLIDDNPHDRLLAIRALEKELDDLEIEQIIRAEDFEQALEKGQFDLVITDYQLRWNNGLAILKRIKSRYGDCPTIMFTNSGSQEVAVEAMKSGLDDYIIKSPQHYIRLPAAVRLALERVENQRKATAIEIRFQTLLDRLNVGVYRLREDGTILEANAAFLRLLRLDSLDGMSANRTLEAYFNPEDYARLMNSLKQNEEVRELEIQLQRADESKFWVKLSKHLSRLENVTVIDGLIEDITERKQAEETLRQTLKRLQFHIENSPVAFIEWDSKFRVMRWSPAAEKIFGWQAEKTTGKNMGDLEFVFKEDLDSVSEIVKQILSTKAQVISSNRNYAKDGSVVYCEWYNSALFDRESNLLSVLSLVLNVSDRVNLEAERDRNLKLERKAREEAEAANQVKDEFLATLSHELRSPLNPILGWSQFLQTQQIDEATKKVALQTIERNAKLQAQLIDDLLDVSRILQGKLNLHKAPVDLAFVIEAGIETVRLAAQAKSIEIQTDFQPDIGQVLGDRNRLQQVVWNLLSNAIKFTPVGGRVQVKLERVEEARTLEKIEDNLPAQEKADDENLLSSLPLPLSTSAIFYAKITVSDTGKGIDANFLPYVFDYFRQADSKTTRQFGGLGLGLAIVRRLVELHGGTVRADSPGNDLGAIFTVHLPLTSASVPLELNNKPPDAASELKDLHVLVVDDLDDSRDLLTFVLEQYGAEVTAVSSARDALEQLPQVQPDLLLCDIGMPEMDGYMLLRQIRALPQEQGGQTPAIALSAYAGEFDRQEAFSAGFQMHLAKPVEPNELVLALSSLVVKK